MTRKYMLMLVLILLPFPAFSKNKSEEKSLSAGALLYLETDLMERTDGDYQAGVLGYLSVTPERAWRFTLQADAGTDAVRLDELWGEYSFNEDSRIRFGIFENGILMEDTPGSERFYADESIVRRRLDEMGWYSKNSAGARYSREGGYFNGDAEFFYISNSSEILMRGNLNIPLKGGRLGASLIYHPYLFHNMWSEEESSSHWSSDRIFNFGAVDPRGIYEIHYFLFNLYWGDLTGEKEWVYKAELTMGNNLADPIGYLGYPGGENSTAFLSGNLLLGRILGEKKFNWTPSVNCSGYMANLEEPNIGSIEIRAGNRWRWTEKLSFFLDTGLEIKNYYLQEKSGETLMTGIDGVLNARAQYSF